MIERSQCLYDCITEIGDTYLEEALKSPLEKRSGPTRWKRWNVLAASILLLVGIGLMFPYLNMGMSEKSEAPAASVPAMSAPAAAAPEMMEQIADQETEEERYVTDGSQTGGSEKGDMCVLKAGQRVCYPDGRVAVLLSEEGVKEKAGLEDSLGSKKFVSYLMYQDGIYCPVEHFTGIALYTCGDGGDFVSDGEHHFTVSEYP